MNNSSIKKNGKNRLIKIIYAFRYNWYYRKEQVTIVEFPMASLLYFFSILYPISKSISIVFAEILFLISGFLIHFNWMLIGNLKRSVMNFNLECISIDQSECVKRKYILHMTLLIKQNHKWSNTLHFFSKKESRYLMEWMTSPSGIQLKFQKSNKTFLVTSI